jgi:hypothetical protein
MPSFSRPRLLTTSANRASPSVVPAPAIAEKESSAGDGPALLLVSHLSSLGDLHRHARIHDEPLVSWVLRPRPHSEHRQVTATPPPPPL